MIQKKDQVGRDAESTPVARLLRSAKACRVRDLRQLVTLTQLVRRISELIHALQKERGASAIFLGSNGNEFATLLSGRIVDSRRLELAVREQLEHIDEQLDRMSSGARLYLRVALSCRALDGFSATRQQVASLAMAPQDAVRAFTILIGSLLAVGFEVADIAADPAISRALVALVNFAQGKEYAGQERASVSGVLSRGTIDVGDHHRLHQLVTAQEQAFRIFALFSEALYASAFNQVLAGHDHAEVQRMRGILAAAGTASQFNSTTTDTWFRHSTQRIDAMKSIEDAMADGIVRLCAQTLAATDTEDMPEAASLAMVVMDVAPEIDQPGMEGGVGLYMLDGLPRPMHSILDVVRAQSRRIDDMNIELESARVALAERKSIERAKGLLMQSRSISEQEAYRLIRDAAMNQNKRIADIAAAIVSMSDLLKPGAV